MGAEIAPRVARRLGRSLLELGGNNAAIVAPSADLDLVVRGVLFAAVGTAGQRCTSLRRLIVHRFVADTLVERLGAAYRSIPLGDPREAGVLVGPLVTGEAFGRMEAALEDARADGGEVVAGGGRVLSDRWPDAWYVEPALVRMPAQTAVVRQETFAPVLYLLTYDDFEEAIELQNGVPQGLASSIFTTDVRESERFLLRHRVGLRDRERQHRPERRRDRRRLRRREGDRWRARVGLRRLEGVYAPANRHRQLHQRAAAGTGHRLRRPLRPEPARHRPVLTSRVWRGRGRSVDEVL